MREISPDHFEEWKALAADYEKRTEEGSIGWLEEDEFLDLLDYYESELRHDQAKGVMALALDQHPWSGPVHMRHARILLEDDHKEAALEALEKAQLMSPNDPEIMLLKAETLTALERDEEALQLLNSLKNAGEPEILGEAWLCEALIWEYRERFDKMFYSLMKSIKLNPDQNASIDRFWFGMEMTGKFEEGATFCQKILDDHPFHSAMWYNLGYALAAQDKYLEATEAFEYAYLTNPEYENAYRDCVESWIHLQEFRKALDVIEDALEHFDADADILLRKGFCYESLGDLDKALVLYLEALPLKPDNDALLHRIGECYFQKEEYQQALGYFLQAVKLNLRQEEYLASLAETYYQLEEDELAAEYFRKAIDSAPEDSSYWIQYATFLLDINEPDLALKVMDEANVHASEKDLHYCTAACLFLSGKRKEAMTQLNKALYYNFDAYRSLFEIAPELETDREVNSLIEVYQQ